MDLYWVRSDFRGNNNNALEQVRKNREKKLERCIKQVGNKNEVKE